MSGKQFERHDTFEVSATPAQVWDAIATGPGIDSWFMGHTEVLDAREGGRTRITMPGWNSESTITAWEPGWKFAYQGDAGPDGSAMAFELLLEGRSNGSTVLRFVHDGFLGGDSWEDEYDALTVGDRMYLEKLAVYLKHFAGRTSTYNLFQSGPQLTDHELVWTRFRRTFDLKTPVQPGDQGTLTVEGLQPTVATVHMERPTYLITYTDDSIFLLGYGYLDTVFAEQHSFAAGADDGAIDAAWAAWQGTFQ
jgi:uncharacterized protein YndB with AHSA1/START domain